jgi:hypothetical protein
MTAKQKARELRGLVPPYMRGDWVNLWAESYEPPLADAIPQSLKIAVKFAEINAQQFGSWLARFDRTDIVGKTSTERAIKKYLTKPIYAKEGGSFWRGKIYAAGEKIRDAISESPADGLQVMVDEFTGGGKLIWRSVIDSATGDVDAALDGQIFDADDLSAPIPPLHPNCRCTREPLFSDG